MRQAIIWTNADPIHWHMYASLWGDDLSVHTLNSEFAWVGDWNHCMYASMNYAIIGSYDGLSSFRYQAITWTDVGSLLFGFLATNFRKIKSRHENVPRECIWKWCLPNDGHLFLFEYAKCPYPRFHWSLTNCHQQFDIWYFLKMDCCFWWLEYRVLFSCVPSIKCEPCDLTNTCYSVSPTSYEIHVNSLRDQLLWEHMELWLNTT